jgi:HNH endonuclease
MACIYCGSDGESDEHLIPQSLGGRLIARFVCESCNNGFSTIDQALAENSDITVPRLMLLSRNTNEAQAGGLHTLPVPWMNSHVDVQIMNQLRPEIIPQIHLVHKDDGRTVLHEVTEPGADLGLKHLIKFVERHSLTGFAGIRQISPEADLPTARLVIRSHRVNRISAGYIRARSDEEADALCDALRTNWEKVKATILEPNHAPVVINDAQASVGIPLYRSRYLRGVAKIAFNILAHHIGPAAMRNQALDSIREFIRGNDLEPAFDEERQEETWDHRFVQFLSTEQILVPVEATHQVTFYEHEMGLMAQVILFKQVLYSVWFNTGEVKFGLRSVVYEFDVSGPEIRGPYPPLDHEEVRRRMRLKD